MAHSRAATCVAGALAKATEGSIIDDFGKTYGFVRFRAARHSKSKLLREIMWKWRFESIFHG